MLNVIYVVLFINDKNNNEKLGKNLLWTSIGNHNKIGKIWYNIGN